MMAPSFPDLATPSSQLIQAGEQKDSMAMVTTFSVGAGLACSHFLHERPISIILLFISPCKTWYGRTMTPLISLSQLLMASWKGRVLPDPVPETLTRWQSLVSNFL